MAATIEAGKWALATIPNVEVVTLFCALYGYVFGWMGMAATLIFVWMESMIWGFNTWVIEYIIHWSAVCGFFWLLGKMRVKNRIILTAVAVILTIAFGVQSSIIDVLVYMKGGRLLTKTTNFAKRFSIYYMRGIWFYVAEVVTNLIVFPILFRPLQKLLHQLGDKYGVTVGNKIEHAKEPADMPKELPQDIACDTREAESNTPETTATDHFPE
jgi:hypothetical protein